MKTVNTKIAAKLKVLLSFLNKTSEEFETVAEGIKDKELKMPLLGLAVETNQYEHELTSQLQILKIININLFMGNSLKKSLNNIHMAAKSFTETDLFDFCRKSEKSFEKAYRYVLNEYFPYPDLKSMLIYQLNGIKCAFMKMKLFNSLTHEFAGIPQHSEIIIY